MDLVKTSFLSLVATSIKMLSALVINKAVALYIGPSGLALIGQFQSFQSILRTISQGGFNSGVVKYTSERADDIDFKETLWSTSLAVTLIISIVLGLILFVFSSYLSTYIFKSSEYSYVFKCFSATLFFYSANQLLLSIINGLKEIRLFIKVNILQSIFSLFYTTFLIFLWGLDGALIALVTNQSIIFVYLIYDLKDKEILAMMQFFKGINQTVLKLLSRYSLMALMSAVSLPIVYMLIRDHIVETLSIDEAGYWQGMIYISTMYLMVITTALNTYYLPRLSEIKDFKDLKTELLQGYKIITPIVAIICFSVYFLREFIIWVLFTEDFYGMGMLFQWQLIGDFIKIMTWLLSYLMLAKAMTKAFIITELIFAMLLYFLSISFIGSYGLIGVTYAFSLSYFIYFILIFYVMNRKFNFISRT